MENLLIVEAGGFAHVADPASPPNPVDVLVDVLGHVEVDDVRHALDVEATRGHGGGHQDRHRARAEVVQRFLALVLESVTWKEMCFSKTVLFKLWSV